MKVLWLMVVLALPKGAAAQQPFYTDDADVTPRGGVHVETFNEFDWLQASQVPHLRQNTFSVRFNYGLGRRVELDLDAPLITILNDPSTAPRRSAGVGDTNFGFKYQLREERKGSSAPALAMATYIEVPTGEVTTGLGSGLTDVWVYGIAQKTMSASGLVLRVNGGYLFSGNTSVGILGITKARGHVATMSGSVARRVSEVLTLGGEVTAAATNNVDLDRGQLQALLGGNYQLRERLTFDFAVIAGHFAASPRVGVQVGFSLDVRD